MYIADYSNLTEIESSNSSSFGYLFLFMLIPVAVIIQAHFAHVVEFFISMSYATTPSSYIINFSHSYIFTD